MADESWQEARDYVINRAAGRCEYCQTSSVIIGQALHVDHINPKGGSHPDNLCLACPNCNLSKSSATVALDLETNQEAPLFNPRLQKWQEHFEWGENYTHIRGRTPTGRATVARLRMNRPRIILARQRWVHAGLHPFKVDDN